MCYLDLAVANLMQRGEMYGVDQYQLRQLIPKISREVWRLLGEGINPADNIGGAPGMQPAQSAQPTPAINPNSALAIMAVIGRGAMP